MNKEQFIKKMSEIGGITQVEACRETNLFIDTLTECLKEDDKVTFQGFGKFEKRIMKEKMGRNPKNGKLYPVPKHNVVRFKAGKSITKEVN